MSHLRDGYFNIKKVFIVITLILLISSIGTTDCCIANNLFGENKGMDSPQKNITKKDRFVNISTAPSYIKFKLKDDETNQIINILLDNSELAYYLAGVEYDKRGRASFPENFDSFIKNEYIPFLIENEGGIKELRISNFPKNLAAEAQFDKKSMKKFFNFFSYSGSLTLKEMGVNSEEELINIYFDYDKNTNYGYLKKEYVQEFNDNAPFISLLLDLNYDVGRMDIAPILYIRKIQE